MSQEGAREGSPTPQRSSNKEEGSRRSNLVRLLRLLTIRAGIPEPRIHESYSFLRSKILTGELDRR